MPMLIIDQSEAWARLGSIGVLRASREEAARGKEALLSGIARRVEEGHRLAAVEKSNRAIQEIARDRSLPPEKTAIGQFFEPPLVPVSIRFVDDTERRGLWVDVRL